MNYLVCGPPGSGKTTYVREHMQRGDIVVDLDAIFQAFTGLKLYDKPTRLLPLMRKIHTFVVEQISPYANKNPFENAWVIMGGANLSTRRRWKIKLNAEIILLAVPVEECMRRIDADQVRLGQGKKYEAAIRKWWILYRKTQQPVIEVR